MFDFSQSLFNPEFKIPKDTQIIFVADLFVDEYVGGAELTSEALINESPYKVFKLKSNLVTAELVKKHQDKFWIFGNFSALKPEIIPQLVSSVRYSILEYDYKYCKFRSPEKHLAETGMFCDCHNQFSGKLISAFYYGSMGLWWMSKKQKERYETLFPFLEEKERSVVLSSVFDKETLTYIKQLRQEALFQPKSKWIVLSSNSWIKGTKAAEDWCKLNNKDYEIVSNLSYHDLLKKLSLAEGFVYLPPGGDTCPRMVIEAKLLGCQLHLNENVQHKDESWFSSIEEIESWLSISPGMFWKHIKKMIEYQPSLSGYTTVRNCVDQAYPFRECIQSMLDFCDEVCVVDGGSTDSTWDELCAWALREPKLVLRQIKRDWNHPRSAVFDGVQKAEARALCSKEFCWQMDCDEVVHEKDYKKIKELARSMPNDIKLFSLPVIEYWGNANKVRLDIMPWKWRLSRNDRNITHGIPKELRAFDENGDLYSLPGSDGCDMIYASTFEPVEHMSFYTQDAHNARIAALQGNQDALMQYNAWFNEVTNNLPSVHHYSWFDLVRKIKLYRDYWTRHWSVLAGESYVDSADTNMMFNVPWSQVTDEMIQTRADELQSIGGWIWHRKWNGEHVPWITTNRTQPALCLTKNV